MLIINLIIGRMGVDEANPTEFEEGECVGLPITYNPSGKYQYYYKNKKLVSI